MYRRRPEAPLFPSPPTFGSLEAILAGSSAARAPAPEWPEFVQTMKTRTVVGPEPSATRFTTATAEPQRQRGRVLPAAGFMLVRSEEHTAELQSRQYLVCRPL